MAKVVDKSLDLNHVPSQEVLAEKHSSRQNIAPYQPISAPHLCQAHLEQSPQTTVMTITDNTISFN